MANQPQPTLLAAAMLLLHADMQLKQFRAKPHVRRCCTAQPKEKNPVFFFYWPQIYGQK